MLALEHITKNYSGFCLGPISMNIHPGLITGFAGPNGAGKSTTLKILMGLLRPDQGHIRFEDSLIKQHDTSWKSQVGFLGEQQCFHDSWSVLRNLQYHAAMQPHWSMQRARAISQTLKLDPKKKVKQLSRGNRLKLAMVCAMAHNPKLLVLDEPTSGLDPITRTELLDLLREFVSDDQHAVLFSTHIIPDLARVADQLILIRQGHIISSGTTDSLTDRWRRIRFYSQDPLNDLPGVVDHQLENETHLVLTQDWQQTKEILNQKGARVCDITRISLDEAAVMALRGVAA